MASHICTGNDAGGNDPYDQEATTPGSFPALKTTLLARSARGHAAAAPGQVRGVSPPEHRVPSGAESPTTRPLRRSDARSPTLTQRTSRFSIFSRSALLAGRKFGSSRSCDRQADRCTSGACGPLIGHNPANTNFGPESSEEGSASTVRTPTLRSYIMPAHLPRRESSGGVCRSSVIRGQCLPHGVRPCDDTGTDQTADAYTDTNLRGNVGLY